MIWNLNAETLLLAYKFLYSLKIAMQLIDKIFTFSITQEIRRNKFLLQLH